MKTNIEELQKQLKQAQEDIIALRKQLQQMEKLATIGILAASVAHEINNPLGAILTSSQMLLMEIEDEEQVISLETVEEGAKRCKIIVRSLLEYARPSKGEFTNVYLEQALKDTLLLVRHQLEQNNIILKEEITFLKPIRGDSNKLKQVFTNLLINAKDAILDARKEKPELKRGNIIIKAIQEDKKVRIMITDDGCGIALENQEKIMEPFYTTKGVGRGTGLGLPIISEIIKEHNGELQLESEIGKGTTFSVILPIIEF